MKRVLYALCTAGLALGLVGCGDSGGGYWPASPAAAPAGSQVEPLGGNSPANIVSNALFSGASTAPAFTSLQTAFSGGCPMLPGLPTIGSAFTGYSKISAASRSKTKSDATTAGITNQAVTTSATDFNKFTHSYSTKGYLAKSASSSSGSSSGGGCACSILPTTQTDSSYEEVTYTYSYTMYVKFMDATGAVIALDTSDSTYWYKLPSDKTVDQVYFYGEMSFEIAGNSYAWKDTTKLGSATDYWKYQDMSKTTGVKVYGKTTTTSAGKYMGTQIDGLTYSFEVSGSNGYCLFPVSSGSYPSGYLKMGNTNLMVTITFDGTKTATVSYSPSAPTGAATTISL